LTDFNQILPKCAEYSTIYIL